MSTEDERKNLQQPITSNNEAWILFMKGRHFMSDLTSEGFMQGRTLLDQAVALDPDFVLAHIGLAEYYIMGATNAIFPRSEIYLQARKEIETLQRLAPDLPQTWIWTATFNQWLEWDWKAADNNFTRAMNMYSGSFNSTDASELGNYSWFLSIMNRYDKAFEIDKKALELDPTSPLVTMSTGYSLILAGRYDEAIIQIKKALELDRNYYFAYLELAWCYCAKGLYEESFKMYESAHKLKPEFDAVKELTWLKTLALSGQKVEVRTKLNEYLLLQDKHYIGPDLIALVYSALNEKENAFKWLVKGYEDRTPILGLLNTHYNKGYVFKNISSDARYIELVKRMKLPDN
ncbi:hypothetical protein BVY01_03635 [bacterium I07]|nr:hypothetical protein BVY01_03635 [bacterium I07]